MNYKVELVWPVVTEHHEDVVVEADLDPTDMNEGEIKEILWESINDMTDIPPDFEIVSWKEAK